MGNTQNFGNAEDVNPNLRQSKTLYMTCILVKILVVLVVFLVFWASVLVRLILV